MMVCLVRRFVVIFAEGVKPHTVYACLLMMTKKRIFGLIGYPLGHSFSEGYFANKFANEGIRDAEYRLFPIRQIGDFTQLFDEHPQLIGLNVTIPYKQQVITYLHALDEAATKMGAVNCIKKQNGKLIGTNTDAFGFEHSLVPWLNGIGKPVFQALVLGNGGSAKAVAYTLNKLGIDFQIVSRQPTTQQTISYSAAHAILAQNDPLLIVQTTPLGMWPKVNDVPPIDISLLSSRHFVFDLIYNPNETLLLQQSKAQGAMTKNGLEMLHLQAERSWQYWNEGA
jgi:shikimate dehydrogenase